LNTLKRSIPILVGFGLLAFFLRGVDLQGIWGLMKNSNLWLVLGGLGAILVMIYIKGIRWSLLLWMQGYRYSVWNCFLIYMNSLFWGSVTPGRAGDFIKVVYLKEDLKQSMGFGMSSVFSDRVFDLYILLVMGGLGLLLYPLPQDPNLVHSVEVFFVVLVGVSVLVLNQKIGGVFLKAIFQKMMGEGLKARTDQAFEDFHRGMQAYYRPAILGPVALTVCSYTAYFFGCYLLAVSMGIQINVFYLAFVVSVVNIVSLLTFAGMGTREGALILLFRIVDLSKEQALAYSFMTFIVGVLIISLLGFVCYLAKPMKWKKKSDEL